MLSNIISWSTAAFGGTPFRFKKSTALGSAGHRRAGGRGPAKRPEPQWHQLVLATGHSRCAGAGGCVRGYQKDEEKEIRVKRVKKEKTWNYN